MKYSLISEEQIAQCVDEINKSIETADGWTGVGQYHVLALLQSLKPSEPIGYKSSRGRYSDTIFQIKSLFDDVPLYALDKEQA